MTTSPHPTGDHLAPDASSLESLRRDLQVRTGSGIGALAAGALLWATFGTIGAVAAPSHELALVWLFGAGLLFPMSLVVGSLLGLDPLAKGNPLGVLAGLLGGTQILFIPVLLGVYFHSNSDVPWMLGVLVGAHLLPFAWVYRSGAYLFVSLGVVITAGGSGLLGRADSSVVSFLVASCLAVGAIWIGRGLRWRRSAR